MFSLLAGSFALAWPFLLPFCLLLEIEGCPESLSSTGTLFLGEEVDAVLETFAESFLTAVLSFVEALEPCSLIS